MWSWRRLRSWSTPAAFAFSGSGKGGYTDREGPLFWGRLGREGSSRLFTNTTRICSQSHYSQFRDSSSIALAVVCKYASGHLLYPFLANLYLGSGWRVVHVLGSRKTRARRTSLTSAIWWPNWGALAATYSRMLSSEPALNSSTIVDLMAFRPHN